MTIWSDHEETTVTIAESAVIDAVFRINCLRLPVDHAACLSSAITTQIPWLHELPCAGIHPVHVAGSQNGWERPDPDSGEDLLLSKRTRLRIRIDREHADHLITELTGQTLNFSDYTLHIESGETKPLLPSSSLFSRYTCFTHDASDESAFVDQVTTACNTLGYTPTKVLCGRQHTVSTTSGSISARSVLLADVPPDLSVKLQETGLGMLRIQGCGLVIPHKSINSVQASD